jgi:thiol-disulfide isomerase/thioredoxin
MNHAFRAFAILMLVAALFTSALPIVIADGSGEDTITMRFFWGDGCPHCEAQKPYNERLLADHPYLVIESYEVYSSAENQRIFRETAAAYGVAARGVPATFIEGDYWRGFDGERTYAAMDEAIIQLASEKLGIDPENTNNTGPQTDPNNATKSDSIVTVPFIGDIDLTESSLLVSTIVISFIDGFNPCSLWLLTFLLGILILTKSRKKMIIVGGVFLLVTAIAYGAFIAGLFSVFTYTPFMGWIRWIVGLIALTFGVVNIKDFFWYKKGISFTISDEHKPGLFKKVRGIMHPGQSTFQMVVATAILALGVTLIELPCTAGFPVIWSSLVALEGPLIIEFLALLVIYLLIYLSIEIIILVSAIVSLNKLVFTQTHGRILKLFGGMIMLFLAVGFIAFYEYMNTANGMLAFIGAAALASVIVYYAHKLFAPREPNAKTETKRDSKESVDKDPERSTEKHTKDDEEVNEKEDR